MQNSRVDRIMDALRDVIHDELRVPLDDRACVAEIVGCLHCLAIEVFQSEQEEE